VAVMKAEKAEERHAVEETAGICVVRK
jgi:hypothetical protein